MYYRQGKNRIWLQQDMETSDKDRKKLRDVNAEYFISYRRRSTSEVLILRPGDCPGRACPPITYDRELKR